MFLSKDCLKTKQLKYIKIVIIIFNISDVLYFLRLMKAKVKFSQTVTFFL